MTVFWTVVGLLGGSLFFWAVWQDRRRSGRRSLGGFRDRKGAEQRLTESKRNAAYGSDQPLPPL